MKSFLLEIRSSSSITKCLFYIIENGVRFTGMPAFGTGEMTPAGERQVWQLVYFIRHLPKVTSDEIDWMKTLNPL